MIEQLKGFTVSDISQINTGQDRTVQIKIDGTDKNGNRAFLTLISHDDMSVFYFNGDEFDEEMAEFCRKGKEH